MAKFLTPAGEIVVVSRRWFPWPNFARAETLEERGLSPKMARLLGKNHLVDWALAVAALLLLAVVAQFFPVVALVLVGLALVALLVWFFSLPWRIEVFQGGDLIDSEACEGYGPTTRRMGKIGALYESAALKPPKARQVATPTLEVPELRRSKKKAEVTSHPMIAPEEFELPALDDDYNEVLLPSEEAPMADENPFDFSSEEEPVELGLGAEEDEADVLPEEAANAFLVPEGPVFPLKPQVQLEVKEATPGESILRKAVRQVTAEEEALARAGLSKEKADAAIVARATNRKKGRFLKS